MEADETLPPILRPLSDEAYARVEVPSPEAILAAFRAASAEFRAMTGHRGRRINPGLRIR